MKSHHLSAMILPLALLACLATARAESFHQAPDPIPAILDAPTAAGLGVSPDGHWALERSRRTLPPVAELAQPAVECAGFRLHPVTALSMEQDFTRSLVLIHLGSLERIVVDFPAGARIFSPRWSPDSRHLAWCLATEVGTALWLTEVATGKSRQLGNVHPATALGSPLVWMPHGRGLYCLNRSGHGLALPPLQPPAGPEVLENQGRPTPARTTPFLIKDARDEALFEQMAMAEIVAVALDGTVRSVLPSSAVEGLELSPDGAHLLVERLHKPWSRSHGAWDFPREILVMDTLGRLERVVAELPLAEGPSIRHDAEREGPRRPHWRPDQPATLCWVQALDKGDPDRPASQRDAVMSLAAPFIGEGRELLRLGKRFGGILWGEKDLALVYESWQDSALQRIWRFTPSSGKLRLLLERDREDAYSEPGWPQMRQNATGHSVLRLTPDGRSIWWAGRGASSKGPHPFLDRMDLATGQRERVWSCRDPWYEQVQAMLDNSAARLLISRESLTEPENSWLLDKSKGRRHRGTADYRARPITQNQDPAPQLAQLQKELLRYRRADGVELSATLYLPPGYRRGVDPPLPALFWVYPREFKSREAAGRVTSSPYTFSRPAGISVLFLLTQGYAVVADPSLPILGREGGKPNDHYLEELEWGARAAVEHVASLGCVDTSRLAIGGHSYGAFTAANLLAHTNLFRTAICRSGAYNRTLTPFGFQGEDRSLWEAEETYLEMSPFLAADQITRPILLIHGAEDPNPGTFPLQSDRFYDALKGLGATARLVRLPAEGHDYRARESVEHALWEMIHWCELHLKGAPSTEREGTRPLPEREGSGDGGR